MPLGSHRRRHAAHGLHARDEGATHASRLLAARRLRLTRRGDQLARLALRDLGFGHKFDDAGYWKWEAHSKMDSAAARKHLEGQAVRERRRTPRAHRRMWGLDTALLRASRLGVPLDRRAPRSCAACVARQAPPRVQAARRAAVGRALTARCWDGSQARWAAWTNETIVLYKSHKYDPELLQLCDSFLVLLSHSGCLERTVLSALAAGFMKSPPTVDAVVRFLQGMFNELFLWRQHASVDLSSEELKAAPLHSAALVHHALSAALDVPFRPLRDAKLQKEVGKESNPSIPHREASDATKSTLRAVMHAAKDRLSYDKRIIGWKWLC